MKLKYLVFFLFIIFTQIINSQLSRKHYIPPLTSGDDFREQFIYISTPKANNVSYKIIPIGNPNLPQYSGIVSNANPVIQPVLDENGNFDLDNDTQLHINRTNLTGAKITNKGFIIEASDVVYVSVRVLTSALNAGNPVHAGALVSKGNAALGKEFRVGAFVNEPDITNLHTAFVSMMATEDNTTITFDNRLNGLNLPSGVPIPNNIILDEAESYIIAIGGNGTDLRNLIGTLVSSDKNIVVNSGSATGTFGPNGNGAGGQDYGFDQIVGADRIGNEYILVKGDGINSIENVLIIAHENNTQITINGNVITNINAGEYYVAEGNLFSGNNNMYINTNKNVFVYQGIGTASLANQGLFFVPPLSCENKGDVNNIPLIDKVGDLTFVGGVTIVTNLGATILINDQPITNYNPIGPSSVTGNPNYVTYRVTGLSDNVKVTSDNELYCAYFNASGFATTGAFYSGFPTPPEFTFDTTVTALGNCIPNVTLQGSNTDFFDSVRWEYFDESLPTPDWVTKSNTGVYKPIASEPGRYRLVGIVNCTGTTFISTEIPVSICPDDFDGDLSIDNLDIDLDNDGILNSSESYGDFALNLTDVNAVNYTIPSTTPQVQNVTSLITKDEAANSITGATNGNFTSTLVAANTSNQTFELTFPEKVNISLTTGGSNTQEITVFYVLKVEPNTKNLTLLDPDGQLLVDSDFNGEFETGVTFISGSEIRFQINDTSSGTPFQFVANQIDKLIFEHHSTGLTTTNVFNGNIQLTSHNRDSDGDGIADAFDLDSDNDGVPDIAEATANKTILSNVDANNDGLDDIFNGVTTNIDTDGDGIPNFLDVDSDNDGIFDWVEAGITTEIDANNDGILDNANATTVGVNGLLNSLETSADSNTLNYIIADTDTDDIYNFLELDADNDECFDVFEAGFTDANSDGILDATPFAVNEWGKVINNADGYTTPNANYITSSPITVTNFTDVTFCESSTDIITIDTNADVFQWQVSTDNGVNFTNLVNDATYNGVNTKDLQITATPTSFNGYQYRVLLSKTGNSCTDKPSNAITLNTNPLPVIIDNAPELDQCIDSSDMNPTVNLTLAESNISNNPGGTFEYFVDLAATNQITNPTSYPVNVNTVEIVYVRVISDLGCFGNLIELRINVGQTPDNPYNATQPPVCDDLLDANGNDTPGMNDDTDGITNFSLDETAIINAINPPANTQVFFYENSSDRNNNLNNIDITNYRNDINKIDITNIPEGIRFPIYYKIVSTINNDCQGLGEFFLEVHAVPVANTVADIEECDDALSGSTTDGRNANINLRAKIQDILGTQSTANYQVTFHTTQNGATTNTDVITNDTAYTNTVQPGFTAGTTNEQTIYVRVQQIAGSQCYNANTSFRIIIQPIPTVSTTISDLIACDVATVSDSDSRNRIAQNIDLTLRSAEILNGRTNYEVEYYITQQDAQNRTNRISNPSNFENTAAQTNFPANFASNDPANQTIFFIVVDNNGLQCPSVFSTFNLLIYPEPATQPISVLSYCDNDDDGDDTNGIIQTIDLNGKIPEILGAGINVNDYIVSFHPTQIDAENNTNNLSSPYTNSTRNETIFVRVLSNISGCTNTTASFALTINELPSFTVTSPQILCLNDVPLNITVENTADVYSYEWRNSNGDLIGTSDNVNISSGGNYTVTATTTNGTNCSRTESVVINESNIANLDESLVTIVDESNNIGATNNLSVSIDNTNNKLGPGDYQFAMVNTETGVRIPFAGFQDEPIFDNIEGGIYQIIVNDKNGCTPDATLTISVLQFPKFFTPNNDGENDFWIIKGANRTLYPNSSINIFNRYGKLIAQLQIGGQGWDGTYNGTTLPTDDYWYNITLIPADASKNTISKKGNFSLLRR